MVRAETAKRKFHPLTLWLRLGVRVESGNKNGYTGVAVESRIQSTLLRLG